MYAPDPSATGPKQHREPCWLAVVLSKAQTRDGYLNTRYGAAGAWRTAAPDRPLPRASAGLRAPWFDVACCPPNLARLVASIGTYQATTDAGGVQLHQLWRGSLSTPVGRVMVETGYPWSGEVTVRVESAVTRPWRLSVRVPQWARGARLSGQPVAPGYATVDRVWNPDDRLTLQLPMGPRWVWPDPRIDAVRGCVAVERGPLVYCAESTSVAVDATQPLEEVPLTDLGPDVIALGARGSGGTVPVPTWPCQNQPPTGTDNPVTCTLVPYHLWGTEAPQPCGSSFPSDTVPPA